MNFPPGAYLDCKETDHAELFAGVTNAWEALPKIGDYLAAKLEAIPLKEDRWQGQIDQRALVGDDVFIGEGAVVEANAVVKGPAWIGAGTTIRSGAYLRENVIAGDQCTLGNSSEFKNCLLFNRCEVPHFNYVGDSILGFKVHLGAGVICSNVRLDRSPVIVKLPDGNELDTGLRKLGAIVGDYTEVGCHTVLSPGSILGRHSIIYPLTNWRGILGDNRIVKNVAPVEVVDRR